MIKKTVTIVFIYLLFIAPMISAYDFRYIDEYIDYQGDFLYRRTITINQSMISGTVENFPMLLNITDEHLNSSCRSDGFDILFTDADNNVLNYERESYSNGSFLGWINVTELDESTDNLIYMYYNDSDSIDRQNVYDTWDFNYVAVYHMNDETTSTINDSTSNANHGTKGAANSPVETSGNIGMAQDFDGSNDYVNCGNGFNGITNNITISAWINFVGNGNSQSIIHKGGRDNDSYDFSMRIHNTNGHYFGAGKTNLNIPGIRKYGPLLNGLYYLSHLYDGEFKFYINGDFYSYDDKTTGMLSNTNNDNCYIGCRNDLNFFVNDYIDEIRISNIARSSDWIKTEYNNQVNATDGGFYSLSDTIDMSFFSIIGTIVETELGDTVFGGGYVLSTPGLSIPVLLFALLCFIYYKKRKHLSTPV